MARARRKHHTYASAGLLLAAALVVGLILARSRLLPGFRAASRGANPAATAFFAGLAGTADPSAGAGRAIYDRECASCHGPHGEGQPNWQVPLPDGSLPAPPHDATGHTWHHPDSLLLGIIADSDKQFAPNSKMPAFRGRLREDEMRAVLAYIKTFWGPREQAYQAEQNLQLPLPSATPPAPGR